MIARITEVITDLGRREGSRFRKPHPTLSKGGGYRNKKSDDKFIAFLI
jgi:hypothetical protein